MTHVTVITTEGQTPFPPRGGSGAPPSPLTAAAALGLLPPDAPPVRSLYVHVPFCFHKCHYCDFYSVVDTQDRQEAFTDRLIGELAALAPYAADGRSESGGKKGRGGGGGGLRTIFVGGGTPTLLRPALWERLLAAIDRCFDLSAIRAGRDEAGEPTEWTVECNPETATPELMALLAAAGVNRISIGAQSFNPAHLRTLERWHDPDNVERAVAMARDAGIPRQSIDLIFGIPGQTLDDWLADLNRAVALGVTHLSCYALTYEPATALTARMKAGKIHPIDEDLEADMLLATVETLRAAGFERYEVSNFARTPDDRSRHNLAYWRQEGWLAAGPSASGHALVSVDPSRGGVRWKNVPRLGDYLESPPGCAPVVEIEEPDPARALRERLMMGLRTVEGVNADSILAHAAAAGGGSLVERLSRLARRLRDEGLLRDDADHWRLTDRAFPIADFVIGKLTEQV